MTQETTTPETPTVPEPPTALHTNLLRLAAHVLRGAYDDPQSGERRLRDQVMRLWRGAPMPTSEDTLALTPLKPEPESALDASVRSDSTTAPRAPKRSRVACGQRRRHSALKQRGVACPECGYPHEVPT